MFSGSRLPSAKRWHNYRLLTIGAAIFLIAGTGKAMADGLGGLSGLGGLVLLFGTIAAVLSGWPWFVMSSRYFFRDDAWQPRPVAYSIITLVFAGSLWFLWIGGLSLPFFPTVIVSFLSIAIAIYLIIVH